MLPPEARRRLGAKTWATVGQSECMPEAGRTCPTPPYTLKLFIMHMNMMHAIHALVSAALVGTQSLAPPTISAFLLVHVEQRVNQNPGIYRRK